MANTGSTNTYFLFTNRTTDGNSDAVSVNYPNKKIVVKVWGTFDGASIKLQTTAPQTNPAVWIDVPYANSSNTLVFNTTNSQATMEFLVQNELVRAVQSSSGGSTSLNVSLEIT